MSYLTKKLIYKKKTKVGIAQHVCFHKNGREYTATSISNLDTEDFRRILLQPDNSQVQMELSMGSGVLSMCVHLDALLFSEIIPENECLIAPIVEVNAYCDTDIPLKSRIRIPHCLQDKSEHRFLTVRHGDIYKDKPFMPVPHLSSVDFMDLPTIDACYEIDEEYIYIYARSYSQFTCTSCKRKCDEDQIVFLSAGFTKFGNQRRLEIKPFICSPLFDIWEYRKVFTYLHSGIRVVNALVRLCVLSTM